ncbi:MAG TPA: DnaB-like helicase C-terminal domain-containing protein, partial [Candidatus Ozemobacteraceae bacterium]|nr:DnaB-like helicase C-terminal domain-containing protein [Candidatus Ozemobacteraceae bacterium]
LAEIIIAKHRNGAVGNVYLRFLSNLAKFANLEDDIPVSREFTSKISKGTPSPSTGLPPIPPSGADFLSGKSDDAVPF